MEKLVVLRNPKFLVEMNSKLMSLAYNGLSAILLKNSVMIFSSNATGGLGGFDLYYVGNPEVWFPLWCRPAGCFWTHSFRMIALLQKLSADGPFQANLSSWAAYCLLREVFFVINELHRKATIFGRTNGGDVSNRAPVGSGYFDISIHNIQKCVFSLNTIVRFSSNCGILPGKLFFDWTFFLIKNVLTRIQLRFRKLNDTKNHLAIQIFRTSFFGHFIEKNCFKFSKSGLTRYFGSIPN